MRAGIRLISAVVMSSAVVLSWSTTAATANLAALAAPATAAFQAIAATGPYTVPQTTKVTPYLSGTHLTWTASDQMASDGAAGPAEATALGGIGGGGFGIVETGYDAVAHQAASWVSDDGGVSWTEHLIPGSPWFGSLAARGGVLVTTSPNGFWSSLEGSNWARATSGPHALQWANLAAGPQGFIAFVRNGSSTITRVWRTTKGGSPIWVAAPVQGVVSTFCPTSIAATSSRIIAIGADCAHPSVPRVLVSTTGQTWVRGGVPLGLRLKGTYTSDPSISYVGGRYLLIGTNSTQTASWTWTSADGRTWRHVSSMTRSPNGFSVDRIKMVVRMGSGWLAMGDRTLGIDDAFLVAWMSADLVHWSRIAPAEATTCDATVHKVSQVAVVGGRLVAVGNPWSMNSNCGETWIATVTP